MPLPDDLRFLAACALLTLGGATWSWRQARADAAAVRAAATAPGDEDILRQLRRAVDSARPRSAPDQAPRRVVEVAPPIEARWQARWFAPPAPAPHVASSASVDPTERLPPRRDRPPRPPRPRTAREAARGPIDIDRADAATIEALPRIGPALARRIVAHRERCGPFGGLDALDAVAGVGPALLQAIAGSVTFSSRPRPSHAPVCPGGAR
jgi:competence protein ComEA